MSDSKGAIPTWFVVVAIVALIWNLMGVMAYITQVTMSPEAFAALPDDKQAVLTATPIWATGAFAVAVFGGALGSLGLVLKKAWAVPILIISLAGVAVQMIYAFFMSHSFEVFGPGGMVMPIMVIIVTVYLVVLSRKAKAQGWLI